MLTITDYKYSYPFNILTLDLSFYIIEKINSNNKFTFECNVKEKCLFITFVAFNQKKKIVHSKKFVEQISKKHIVYG